MAEKVVSVRLRANVEGFTAGMAKARKSVDDLTKADVPKAAKGYADLSNKAALAGAAIAVGLGVAVKRFADFDAAMSAVKANVGGTVSEMEMLRKAAIKLGADSQFSATEAAQGINELGKAGIKSADILNGGLKGALDLAAAGQISVAQAAETTASAMTQFGLNGDKAVHVADLLASGANKAQGGVGDLGAALGQAGLVAAATGLSIEETAAGLTAFASAGLIGSDAGTSFKTMLQRLSAPSGEAATLMKELGISAYDSQGNFVGLANVAGQLRDGMEDLTPAQRNAAMATIFGSDAVRASNILYEQGAEGIRKWTDEVNDQGAAARQAATLTDNLSGDIERLGGAFDSVLIQTGSGANASLRTLVQGLEGLVETVGKIPGPVLLVGAGLAALALAVPKGITSFKNYTATLDSVGLSFDKISAKGPRAAKGMKVAAGAAKALGVAFVALEAIAVASHLGDDSKSLGVDGLTKSLTTGGDAVGAFRAQLKHLQETSTDLTNQDVKSFGDAIKYTFSPDTFASVDHAIQSFGAAFGIVDSSAVTRSAERLSELDQALAGLVATGAGDQAAAMFNQFADAAAEQGVSVEQLKSKLPGYASALSAVDASATEAAGSSGELASATEDLDAKAKAADDALKNLKDAIDGLGSAAAQQRAAERDFQAAIDDTSAAIEKNGKTLDEHTEKGRDNQAALDDLVSKTKEKAKADFDAAGGISNLDAATKAATKATQEGRDAFIKAAVAAGATKKEAGKLADQLGLIPKDVAIAVSQSGAAAAGVAIDQAARDRTSLITVQRRFADFKDKQASDAGEVKKATGGAIYGAGTGTSDSIPAWLSNGEHVWTAAEVSRLGGQSAMYALRSAVRQGNLPRFATGGAVQYAPAVAYAGPTSHSTTNDSRLVADVVNIVTNDANSFKREIRTKPYRAKARPGR